MHERSAGFAVGAETARASWGSGIDGTGAARWTPSRGSSQRSAFESARAREPLAPLVAAQAAAPVVINPGLFQKAKAALDAHRYEVRARDSIGIVVFSMASRDARFHLVDLMNGTVESFRVAHGSGSDRT